MDFDLTDEQQLIQRDRARPSPTTRSSPRARENDRNHHFDTELVQMIAAQGYLGAIVPREYGGAGLDYITYAIICEEIGRGCSAMRTVVSVQTSLVCSTILSWGTEEQKQKYLPKLCSGEWLGCFGLTEPDTGSDAANQKTRATQDRRRLVDQRQRRCGSRSATTPSSRSIFAQTDPALGHRGLACFLVETDQPGFSHAGDPRQDGPARLRHRGDRARRRRSPADSMLGEVGDGFKVAMTRARLGPLLGRRRLRRRLPGLARGVGRLRQGARAVRPPIAAFQLVQAMIADMMVRTDAARMLVYRAGWVKDEGQPETPETSIAKFYATEAAQCANPAIQVHGGAGYVDDHPVERYFRDVRVTTLYEGTSQIQKLIIGRAVTGINALV